MANPVTVSAVEARWRPFTPDEVNLAQALIDDAWSVLTTKLPTLDQRIQDEEIDDGIVVAVVSQMVLRVLKNPSGILTQSIDGYSYTRDRVLSSGALYATDDELDLLRDPDQQSGSFTIRPYGEPGYATAPDTWGPA